MSDSDNKITPDEAQIKRKRDVVLNYLNEVEMQNSVKNKPYKITVTKNLAPVKVKMVSKPVENKPIKTVLRANNFLPANVAKIIKPTENKQIITINPPLTEKIDRIHKFLEAKNSSKKIVRSELQRKPPDKSGKESLKTSSFVSKSAPAVNLLYVGHKTKTISDILIYCLSILIIITSIYIILHLNLK